MNKEEIKVMIKDGVYSEDGITYMSDKQYNNYIDIIEQLQQQNKKYKEIINNIIEKIAKELKENKHLSYEEAFCILIALEISKEVE